MTIFVQFIGTSFYHSQKNRTTSENLILDSPVQILSSENKLSEVNKIHSIVKLFERIVPFSAELFKAKVNLMLLSFYSNDHR